SLRVRRRVVRDVLGARAVHRPRRARTVVPHPERRSAAARSGGTGRSARAGRRGDALSGARPGGALRERGPGAGGDGEGGDMNAVGRFVVFLTLLWASTPPAAASSLADSMA